jgi:hypothetical protein
MRFHLGAAIALLALLPIHSSALEPQTRVPTEVWVSADDALTLRFRRALETQLGSSAYFAAPKANSSDAVILTIPRGLYWQDVKGQTNFEYVVIFTDKDSRYLGVSIGPCWEKGMAGCAAKVVEDARNAWNRRESLAPSAQ